jgi:hypothetical protein
MGINQLAESDYFHGRICVGRACNDRAVKWERLFFSHGRREISPMGEVISFVVKVAAYLSGIVQNL